MQKLQTQLHQKSLIVSDPVSIKYLTGYENDPGERMMVLLVHEDDALFILNAMFPKPESIQAIYYQDSDNPLEILSNNLRYNDVYVDGNLPSRFLIPLMNNHRTFKNGSYLIENLRRIKTLEERKIMKTASKHNDRIMEELVDAIYEGMTEIELANLINQKQSTHPLTGVSFNPISVFTENIANPHAIPSNRTLKDGDVILIDMGGIYNGYHSDMTRTFFFGENKEIEKLYDIVLEANLMAIKAIKIGEPLSTVDKAARDVITKAGYGEYFTHRTGHGIGLETHENLDVSSTNHTPIEVGMCFSIEPGIYIEGVGGVRIEDLIIIEETGPSVINHYPKIKQDIKKRD